MGVDVLQPRIGNAMSKITELTCVANETLICTEIEEGKFSGFYVKEVKVGDRVISLVGDAEKNPHGRPFVPTLLSEHSDNELIIQYLSVMKGIRIRGHVVVNKGSIRLNGDGFDVAVVAAVHK